MIRCVTLLSTAATLGVVAPSAAQVPVGIVDPAPVIDGFSATCHSGFPDEQAVMTAAAAAGFVERQISIRGGSGLPKGMVLPRMWQRGEAMMSLLTMSGAMSHARSCQVSAMASGKIDLAEFTAAVASRLKLGAPRWAGKGDAVHADWAIAQTMTLRAQISRYGNVRSYLLQLMNYREGAAG